MSKKNIVFLVVVVLVLIPAIWLLINKNNKSTIPQELRDFAVSDTTTIDKIFLADKGGQSVTLTKQDDGTWWVNDKFEAREDLIKVLLYTLKKIEVLSPVAKTAQETIIKSLASSAIKVEVYQNGELSKLYYVGGETQDQMGTFMLLADPSTRKNSSAPFIMFIPGFNGYVTSRYVTKENEWRAKHIFTYDPEELKSVRFELNDSLENYFLLKQKSLNSFELSSNGKTVEGLDTLAVKQYLGYFRNIQYESLEKNLRQSLKDSVFSQGPFASITVKTKEGEENKVKLFNMWAREEKKDVYGLQMDYDPDRMYALINNDSDTVIVQYFVFGKLMPELSYFTRKPNI